MANSFVCVKCGNCCRPHGYVRLLDGEAELIAGYLGEDILAFVKNQTRITDDRKGLSLKENEDGSCIFLSQDNSCVINEVKPQHCQDFPAKWNYAGYEKICEGTRNSMRADV